MNILNHRWAGPPLAAGEMANYNAANASQQYENYIQTYLFGCVAI